MSDGEQFMPEEDSWNDDDEWGEDEAADEPATYSAPPDADTNPRSQTLRVRQGPMGETKTVRLPIWVDASRMGSNNRLKVQRRASDGTIMDLGTLAHDATEAQLLSEWPKPGTYLLTPVSEHGRPLAQPIQRIIDADHQFFRNGGGGVSHGQPAAAAPAIPVELIETLRETISALRHELHEERQLRVQQEQKLHEERIKMIEERAAMQREYTEKAASLSELGNTALMAGMEQIMQANQRMSEAQIQRMQADSSRSQEQQANFFSSQLQQQQNFMSEINKAQEMARQSDQTRAEREREREREMAKAMGAIEKERSEFIRQQFERESQRQMEWMTMQLQAQKGGNLLEQVEQIKTLGSALGMSDDKPQPGLIGQAMEIAKLYMQAQGAAASAAEEDDDIDPQIVQQAVAIKQAEAQLGQYTRPDIWAQLSAEQQAQMQQRRQQIAQARQQMTAAGFDVDELAAEAESPVQPMQQIPQQPQQPQLPDYGASASPWAKPTEEAVPVPAQPFEQTQPPLPSPEPPRPAPPAQPKGTGMTPKQEKKARHAVEQCLQALRKADRSEWDGIITRSLVMTPAMIEYFQAHTVKAAIIEAGADEEMTQKVITAVREHAMVPDDFPLE